MLRFLKCTACGSISFFIFLPGVGIDDGNMSQFGAVAPDLRCIVGRVHQDEKICFETFFSDPDTIFKDNVFGLGIIEVYYTNTVMPCQPVDSQARDNADPVSVKSAYYLNVLHTNGYA